MRNILVFPSGETLDFMYPANKKLIVGSHFNISMDDNTTEKVEISKIVSDENVIYYHLITTE